MSDIIYIYRVSPRTQIGRVEIDNGEVVSANGVGASYLNAWEKADKTIPDFVDYFADWSNGRVMTKGSRAEVTPDSSK